MCLNRGAISATLALYPATGEYIPPTARPRDARAQKVKFVIEDAGCTNLWADYMRPYTWPRY